MVGLGEGELAGLRLGQRGSPLTSSTRMSVDGALTTVATLVLPRPTVTRSNSSTGSPSPLHDDLEHVVARASPRPRR